MSETVFINGIITEVPTTADTLAVNGVLYEKEAEAPAYAITLSLPTVTNITQTTATIGCSTTRTG